MTRRGKLDTLTKAIMVAAREHEGQFDKAGQPYILHVLRVMLAMKSRGDRIVAVLHDVLEDGNRDLLWLPGDILADVVMLTRNGEPYEEYIARVAKSPRAARVKLADLADNLDRSRIPNPTPHDEARWRKYERAVKALQVSVHPPQEGPGQ